MSQVLIVQRLRGGTIIKTIMIGSIIGCTLLGMFFGVLALLGIETVKFNGEYILGFKGFISAPLIGALMGSIFGLFTGIFTYIGLRVLAKFKTLTIEYVPVSTSSQSPSD